MQNNKNIDTDVLIIGSGPAGYSAAIYSARACLNTILVAGNQKGGQLTITTDVENYPGFAETIQGPWLMDQMESQVKHCGAQVIDDHIEKVDFSMPGAFKAYSVSGVVYNAKSVIICTGASAKWLGLPSEKYFRGYGVSGCATCDGFFYRNKDVIVVGGGNTAVEEALYLTNHAKKVTLIHRRDSLRADQTLQRRLFSHDKITVKWNTELHEVLGNNDQRSVTGCKLKNTLSGEIEEVIIDGIFIAIGHIPNSNIFKDYLRLNNEGYIVTKPGTANTNIPGVFAAGDVQDHVYRQAVTAAGTGCMAALDAERYIKSLG